MPQLDFNVIFVNFLLLASAFILFYFFVYFFLLNRVVKVTQARTFYHTWLSYRYGGYIALLTRQQTNYKILVQRVFHLPL